MRAYLPWIILFVLRRTDVLVSCLNTDIPYLRHAGSYCVSEGYVRTGDRGHFKTDCFLNVCGYETTADHFCKL